MLIANISAFGQVKIYKPSKGKTVTYTICQGIFTDTGDSTANYSAGEQDTIIFKPSTAGAMMKVTFRKFSTAAYDDVLSIYYGTGTSKKLDDFSGDYAPGTIISNSSDGALTFVFSSASGDYAGWVADISCSSGSGLSCATILSPASGATNVSITPHISWQAVTGATSYNFIYGYYAGHTPVVVGTINTTATSVDTFHLMQGSTYLWKIVPKNGADTASGCSVNTFTTASIPNCSGKPTPVDGATAVSSYTLSWASVSGATDYKLYYGTTSNLSGVKYISTDGTTSFKATLNAGIQYFWKVVPVNSIGDATGCTIWSFTTSSGNAPSCASTSVPADASTGVTSYVLSWAAVTGATSYNIYLSSTTTLPATATANVTTNTYTASLSSGITYSWKVVPVNGSGSASGCSTYCPLLLQLHYPIVPENQLLLMGQPR